MFNSRDPQNLSLFFQSFALASLIANSLCALSNKGGL